MPDPIRGISTANPITATATAQASSANAADAANASTPATGGGSDLADVGQTEALLQTIGQAASTTSGIDQGKVAELQKAISSGAYQANPQSIAQKMVELEDLLGTGGQVR
jgi:negative regulator of flagellin synthesis FlgM